MEHHSRCPNCGRNLSDDEIYCYFCEIEVTKDEKYDKKHNSDKKH